YQTTPGESWDFNSNMDIVLADLNINGQEVKALMHAPKNGFFYVINREDGQLISAEPFVETTWATHVDMTTGRPVEVKGARYENGAASVTPMAWGAHSWHAMSYNPMTGLAYIPAIHASFIYSDDEIDLENFQAVEFEGGTGVSSAYDTKQPREYPGSLIAWDPVKQEEVWTIPQNHMHGPGTLTTAGNLVFQGSPEGKLHAYNATTGDMLWTFDLGLGIAAPPITYKINGRQYISLLVGWGGGYAGLGGVPAAELGWAYRKHMRRLVTFSLEGKQDMPKLAEPFIPQPADDPDFIVDDSFADIGALIYGKCSSCHGGDLISGGMAPDLRASAIPFNAEAFAAVVREGGRVSMGMPQYADMTDQELEGLRHFIRKTARNHLTNGSQSSGTEGGN
ncbi:MAG: c-type cytochrome, partial [Cyclobacteriaceae bacterium]